MNQREKILAYAVGGLLLVVGAQYFINGYRTALETRRKKVANLESLVEDKEFESMVGEQAMMQLTEYRKRSLPRDAEAAQAQYKAWLEKLIAGSELDNWIVDYVGDQGSNRLFRVYTFRVVGNGNIKLVSEVIRDFHKKNYLQRIKKLTLRRIGDEGQLLMNLDVEAVALLDAAEDQPPPTDADARIVNAETHLQSIINRNMFSPPNREPRYAGNASLEAYIERDFATRLRFEDPDDGDRVDYKITSELPPGFQFNNGEIIGRAKEKGTYTLNVVAWDSGLPSKRIEQEIQLTVGDAPPAPEPPPGPPKFDESRQAILTGLVQSNQQWSAWINVRTKSQMLKLRVGDDFEVGSVTGKIVEVTNKYVVFESDGEKYTLKQDSSLADAKSTDVN